MGDMYSIKQESMALTNVYRAKVTVANSSTGEIRVLVPSALGPDSEVPISYWGRKAINNLWAVPSVGDLIVVGVEDANFTNVYWLDVEHFPIIPAGYVTNSMLAGSIESSKLAGGIAASKLASYPKLVIPHTFAINGLVSVANGQYDYISPFFIKVPSTQTVKLISARHRINAGTSATVKVQINGVDATGFTGMSVTTTSTDTDPTDISLANNDLVSIVVTAVSGSPQNLSMTLFFEYTWVG